MSVTVVLDYPARHRGRRLRRSISALVGALMVFAGLVASVGVLPSLFYVFGIVAGAAPEDMPASNGAILLAAAVSIALSVAGVKFGLRVVRGSRHLVLFLRRFGDSDATRATTFAAEKTIGGSWRLVTLDDAAIAPLGMPAAAKRLVVGGGLVRQTLLAAAAGVTGIAQYSLGAPWIIIGLAYVQSLLQGVEFGDAMEPYADVFASVMEGRLPLDALAPDLVGAFAVAATLCALTVVALLAAGIVSVALVFLSIPLAVIDHASDAAQTADRSTTRRVDTAAQVDSVAHTLAAESRRIFAPRLVVLRVASDVWQQTVMRLASAGSLIIIDVSEPTENLLWEIRELTGRFALRCVFVGEQDRVAPMAVAPGHGLPLTQVAELLLLLEGREVLAYTTDRRGMRRFARALRSRLLNLSE